MATRSCRCSRPFLAHPLGAQAHPGDLGRCSSGSPWPLVGGPEPSIPLRCHTRSPHVQAGGAHTAPHRLEAVAAEAPLAPSLVKQTGLAGGWAAAAGDHHASDIVGPAASSQPQLLGGLAAADLGLLSRPMAHQAPRSTARTGDALPQRLLDVPVMSPGGVGLTAVRPLLDWPPRVAHGWRLVLMSRDMYQIPDLRLVKFSTAIRTWALCVVARLPSSKWMNSLSGSIRADLGVG